MTNIRLFAEGAKARVEVDGILTSGMVGIPVTIQCDDTWDGLTKNLVCRGGWGCEQFHGITKTVLDVGESATVAHEVMVGDSDLYLGLEGYNADGTLVIPTTWAYCGRIRNGAQSTADPSANPTTPVWAQVKAELARVPQLVESGLTRAKEEGIFDGKDGADGQKGSDGITPRIGENGNWFLGERDTGVSASGEPGEKGADGVSPTISVSKSGKVTTITITDKNGTRTATIQDGADGEDGKDGEDGVNAAADDVPAYWKASLDAGAEAINRALCEAGCHKSSFLFYSDSHWNYGAQVTPALLKYLYRHTGMTKTFFGGDIVNNESTEYDTMKYLWDWRNQLKDLPNHHSVVGNHDDGNAQDNLFSEQYVYGYLLSAEETPDLIRGESGFYYYLDVPAEKTRYLCLDTAYKGVDSAQQEFARNALLTTPDGWHIIAVSHIWHDVDYEVSPPVPSGLNAGASVLLGIFDDYNSRNGDFEDCTGWVEFCIGGHTHWDYDSASEKGIPILLVETDSWHIRSGLSYTAGTTTEASVNGIVADYDAKTIRVIRVGRGTSREVEMTWYEAAYTNLIPTALDVDGATVYNGVGYKENIRLSGSSGSFRDNTGSCCTGYIKTPVGEAFTVYMKNITANTANNYGFVVNLLTGTGVAITDSFDYATNIGSYSAVYDDNGNVIQFTVPAGNAHGYMVISAVKIDDTSIITINEPIA